MYNGKPIKDKRKELGLSAQELGELIGVKEWGNIYKWEKGTKPHDPEDFQKIENWLSGKTETVTNSKNSSVGPQEAQHAPDYRDDMIAYLKKEISLNEARVLQLLQRNHAMLKGVVEILPILVAKMEKIKPEEAALEMRNKIEHHLDALKKENI